MTQLPQESLRVGVAAALKVVHLAVCFCLQLLKEKTEGRLLVEALVPDFQVGKPQ